MTRRLALAAALVLLLTLTVAAPAVMIAPSPIPDRVAQADLVFVGKVTAIEDKTVMSKRFPGAGDKTEYRVALVQIQDPVKGTKSLTHVRLGFVPPPPPPPAPPPGAPQVFRSGGGRAPQLNHTVGQEALFFVKKHFDGDFYTAAMYFEVVEKKSGTFDKDLALARRCAKLLDDPRANLQAKNADDRLATAAMLLNRYRTPKAGTPNPKTEPIDAAESALILKAIAAGDWTKQPNFQEVSPQFVFGRLNLKIGRAHV